MRAHRKQATRALTAAAILSALGVVLLAVGAFVQVMDISMAVITSFAVILAVIELKGAYPYLIFAVTTVLSLLLLPVKTPAVMYALFFGYYPILKEKIERFLPRLAGLLLKIVVFNIALAVMIWLATLLALPDFMLPEGYWWVWFALCTPVFVLYDVALTRVLTFYLIRLRKRLRFFREN